MAWRPTRYLLEGELDNTQPGMVRGWMLFAGVRDPVIFDLKGDFHRDIRGTRIAFTGDGSAEDEEAWSYMHGFAQKQTGNVGDITAGLPPQDYVDYPYIEWYSERNGRVVIELESSQVKVIGTALPASRMQPVSREAQAELMAGFLVNMASAFGQKGKEPK